MRPAGHERRAARRDLRGRALPAALAALAALAAPAAPAAAQTILDTKHNLSVSGPGPIRALTETRVCVFCHTPHNANPRTPLWNRELGATTYALYTNPPTLRAAPGQPNGPSRLCLSCHDGTIALGAVLRPSGGLAMTGELVPGSPALIGAGADLSRDHPLSFPYADAALDPTIRPAPGAPFVLYSGGLVECPTCHDAHKDLYRSPDRTGVPTGKFLVEENRSSALCLGCHDVPGWVGSSHEGSGVLVDATLFPVPPRQWPTWPTVGEWGCSICHAAHGSGSGPMLLYDATEAETCGRCHGPTGPGDPHAVSGRAADIVGQTLKLSAHRMGRPAAPPVPGVGALRGPAGGTGGVTCADCHNPHEVSARQAGVAGSLHLAGSIRGVPGVDRTGTDVAVASREYEICFRCHADQAAEAPAVPRVVSTANVRLEFDTANASFHPVVGAGRSRAVPSLRTRTEPGLTAASTITCSDCHRDDNGVSAGPHGSSFPPLLRERYETADGTPEGPRTFALCYRCHERSSILADESFRARQLRAPAGGGGHSGHLAAGTPCSACHDAHGVVPEPGTGDHVRLINFDMTIVGPAPGRRVPLYAGRGAFSGSCTLVCHGKVHEEESYP